MGLRIPPALPSAASSLGCLPTFSPRGASAIPLSIASHSQFPQGLICRTTALPPKRGRRQLWSILGSGNGRNGSSRCWCRAAHSMATWCGARRRWLPSPSGHRHRTNGTHRDAVRAPGAVARWTLTTCQGYANQGGHSRSHEASARLLQESIFPYRILSEQPTGISSWASCARWSRETASSSWPKSAAIMKVAM
jgi:hypothetical protein